MAVLSKHEDGLLSFHCPGCKCSHVIAPRGCNAWPINWDFNGDMDRPTVNPSILVRTGPNMSYVCHSFIRDGQIQYLSDCTHELAGKTIPMLEED